MRRRYWKPRASNPRPAPKTFRSRASSRSRAPFRLIPRIDRPRSQFCLQTADKFGQSRLALALEAFGRQNRLHLRERAIDIGIDDHVVVLGPVAHLVGGLAHARMDDLIGVLRSRSQPQLEVRNRRRQHEDADEIAICLLTKLLRALPVDVEQNVAALDQSRLDWQPRRAIAISEHLR